MFHGCPPSASTIPVATQFLLSLVDLCHRQSREALKQIIFSMAKNHEHIDGAVEQLLESDLPSSPPHSILIGVVWHLFLLTIICIFFLIGLAIGLKSQQRNVNRSCFARTSKPSPLLSGIEVFCYETQFNGSLLKEVEYRQRAGPEVDAAWEALGINCQSSRQYHDLQQLNIARRQ